MKRPHDRPGPGDNSDLGATGDDGPLPREACAWCGRVLREGPEPTSHGICAECMARLESSLKRPKR